MFYAEVIPSSFQKMFGTFSAVVCYSQVISTCIRRFGSLLFRTASSSSLRFAYAYSSFAIGHQRRCKARSALPVVVVRLGLRHNQNYRVSGIGVWVCRTSHEVKTPWMSRSYIYGECESIPSRSGARFVQGVRCSDWSTLRGYISEIPRVFSTSDDMSIVQMRRTRVYGPPSVESCTS